MKRFNQDLRVGCRVAIAPTPNVLSRMPHLVGKVGTIRSVPNHPNTWFHVSIPGEPKDLTFQQTALHVVELAQSGHGNEAEEEEEDDNNREEERNEEEQQDEANGEAGGDEEQDGGKGPNGEEGSLDKRTRLSRPTRSQRYEDRNNSGTGEEESGGAHAISTYSTRRGVKRRAGEDNPQQEDDEGATETEAHDEDEELINVPITEWPEWPDKDTAKVSDVVLQQIGRESWIGQPVLVMSGTHKGRWARVIGTASGWIHVRLSPDRVLDPKNWTPRTGNVFTDISKRATELCLFEKYTLRGGGSGADRRGPKRSGTRGTNSSGGNGGTPVLIQCELGELKVVGREGDEGEDAITTTTRVKVGDTVTISQPGKPHDGQSGVVKSLLDNDVVEVQLDSNNGGAGGSSSSFTGNPNNTSRKRFNRAMIINTGEKGTVIKSGHGFYTIRIDSAGAVEPTNEENAEEGNSLEVQKRREDLQFLTDQDLPDPEEEAANRRAYKRRMQGGGSSQHHHTSSSTRHSDGAHHSNANNNNFPSQRERSRRERRPARRSRYEEDDAEDEDATSHGRPHHPGTGRGGDGATRGAKRIGDRTGERDESEAPRGVVDFLAYTRLPEIAALPADELARVRRRIALHNRRRLRSAVSSGDRITGPGGEEAYPQTRLEAAQRQRQENIVRWLSYARERLEHSVAGVSGSQKPGMRPDLKEWLDRIQGTEDEEEEDEYTPPLFALYFCDTCMLEKESESDSCWNPACWKSPIYSPGADPIRETALPSGQRSSDAFSAIMQSPRKPGYIEVPEGGIPSLRLVPYSDSSSSSASSLLSGSSQSKEVKAMFPRPRDPSLSTEKNEDEEGGGQAGASSSLPSSAPTETRKSRFTAGIKRMEAAMVISPLISFNLRAPKVWLEAPEEEETEAMRNEGGNNPTVASIEAEEGAFDQEGYFSGWKHLLSKTTLPAPSRTDVELFTGFEMDRDTFSLDKVMTPLEYARAVEEAWVKRRKTTLG